MTEPKVGLEITAKEQFSNALRNLLARGQASHREYRRLKKEYRQRVADDVGFTPELKPTSEALANLLGTIPGVEITPETKETMAKASSLIASSEAVSAYMHKEGESHTGAYVSFSSIEQGEATVELERVVSGKRLEAKLKFTSDGNFLRGIIGISDVERQGFSISRGSIALDAQGKISEVSKSMKPGVKGIKRVNIPSILHAITTTESLNQQFNIREILTKAAL